MGCRRHGSWSAGGGTNGHETSRVVRRATPGDRVLVALEYFTGVTALVGGVMLVARPDGSLLQAKVSALGGSPFSDWRLPGVLLAA